jgi:hypothetical protein
VIVSPRSVMIAGAPPKRSRSRAKTQASPSEIVDRSDKNWLPGLTRPAAFV